MRPARVSTIVWGVILLLIAGACFAITALEVAVFTPSSVAYVVVGLGALLVLAAIVGAIARSVKPAAEPVAPAAETPVTEAPVTETPVAEPIVPVEPEPTAAPAKRATPRTARASTKDQPVD